MTKSKSGKEETGKARAKSKSPTITPGETAEAERNARLTILECPACYSHRASILNMTPLRARCSDCGTTYTIKTVDPTPDEEAEPEPAQNKKRKTKADYRAEITPAPPPTPKELGFNTTIIEETIAAGPAGLRQAQRVALRFAKQFQQEAIDHWRKETEWLKSFDAIHRACARYALVWRPRFLSALAMCHSPELAARHTRISPQMAYYHRAHDTQFAEQWDTAKDHAIEMLHARVFQRALEGDCEPVFYMGVPVAYIRKFDSKLQIEMLRAYMPDKFKTPGQGQVMVNTGPSLLVLTEQDRAKLIEARRRSLALMPSTREEAEERAREVEQTGNPHSGEPGHQ